MCDHAAADLEKGKTGNKKKERRKDMEMVVLVIRCSCSSPLLNCQVSAPWGIRFLPSATMIRQGPNVRENLPGAIEEREKGTSTCRIRLWRCSLAHILWRRNSDMARRSRSNGAAHWIEGKSENGSPYSVSVYCFDLRWTKRNGVVFFMKLTRISLSPLTHILIDSAEQRSVYLLAIKSHFILCHQ